MTAEEIAAKLRAALAAPLPGPEGPPERAGPPATGVRPRPRDCRSRARAVLLALRFDSPDGRISFPLIRRPDSMEHHAGQIALPGGVIDEGEAPVDCALREAEEEIGLDPSARRRPGKAHPVRDPDQRLPRRSVRRQGARDRWSIDPRRPRS